MLRRQVPRVGIFSRSGESEYRWLVDGLREWQVSPFIITNSNYGSFCEEIYKCSFGILYHSRNRGRVNITDVTDSLYDEELRKMSQVLGKDQVIAVIDDLDDSSPEAKERIRSHQHSLSALTRDIILISTRDKASNEVLRLRVETITLNISRSLRTGITEVDSIPGNVSIQGLPSYPDHLRSRDDASPGGKENMKKIVISGLSIFVFWVTYLHPDLPNGALSVLWGAVMCGVLYNHQPAITQDSRGRCALSCAVAIAAIYDTYHRPGIFRAVISVLWITNCARGFWPRSHLLQIRPLRWAISYGLVLLTFWKGWQESDAEPMISDLVLRSPLILAVDDI